MFSPLLRVKIALLSFPHTNELTKISYRGKSAIGHSNRMA